MELGATWLDAVDGTGAADASGTVNKMVPGTYVISYNFTDSSGNAADVVTRGVEVVDSTAPVITLIGDSSITHAASTAYSDAGATWTDLVDGSGSLVGTGTVDVNTPGSYQVSFNYTDQAGNAASVVTRTVQVVDNDADTDGDGFNDFFETSVGSDINDSTSTPFNYGLVAWYPFDGNASDMSGNGNNLTGSGNSFGEDRHGVIGKSCRLDQVYLSDTNASFSIDDNASFSYSLWVQMNSVPSAYPEAFGLRDSTGNGETLRIGTYHIQDQNKFAVDHLSTGTNSSHTVKAWANQTTQIGRWYQITLVSSLSEVKLFIDSSLHSQVPFQRDAAKNDQVAIYVGGVATWNLFDGCVDDIRIYDRALSAEEIGMLYHMEMPKLDLNDSNFKDAVNLWFSDEQNANATYGHISDWNVTAVTDMTQAFFGRSSFDENITGWDVSNVTNMSRMFEGASTFNQPIGDWNVSSVTNMQGMFDLASAFNQDISTWNISTPVMSGMFQATTALSNANKGKIHVSFSSNSNWPYDWRQYVVIDDSNFQAAVNLWFSNQADANATYGQISDWNVSAVTDMSWAFGAFNQAIPYLGDWDTSSVIDMNWMFSVGNFQQDSGIGNWDTSSVTNMSFMFESSNFNEYIGDWNTSSLVNMTHMFGYSPFNQDISDWDTSSVTSMTAIPPPYYHSPKTNPSARL